jgi:hypothetical protein
MDTNPENAANATIRVPAPTGWPIVAAFGFSLIFAGLLTHPLVSVVGAAALAAGLCGWAKAVLPTEAQEGVPVIDSMPINYLSGRGVRHLRVGEGGHRARLPIEIYPYSAGLLGGLVGGGAMVVLALTYGMVAHHSPWYAVNLLAASGSASIAAMNSDELLQFHAGAFALATVIHVTGSALIGLLYGFVLPIFSRSPVLVGGIIGPLLWSGLLYSLQGIINPALSERVDWTWFAAFQLVFGISAGLVVVRRERVYTLQYRSFAEQAHVVGTGLSRSERKAGE